MLAKLSTYVGLEAISGALGIQGVTVIDACCVMRDQRDVTHHAARFTPTPTNSL